MIQYEGYEIKHEEPTASKVEARNMFHYSFYYEDWTGESVYKNVFPEKLTLKQFGFLLLYFMIMLIILRISIALM